MPNLETILSIASAIGGTGVISFFVGKRERKAQVQVTEASALQEMQKSYTQYVIDNEKAMAELRKELEIVKNEFAKQKQQCKNCSNK